MAQGWMPSFLLCPQGWRGGFSSFAQQHPQSMWTSHCSAELYWTAPEQLWLPEVPWSSTPQGDVYSFTILMRELIHTGTMGPLMTSMRHRMVKWESLLGKFWLSGLALKCWFLKLIVLLIYNLFHYFLLKNSCSFPSKQTQEKKKKRKKKKNSYSFLN